jgi:hypothetical protein
MGSRSGKYFDLAIVESGNGGDLQMVGNDLGVVTNNENQPYLAMFSGNADKSQWWGNQLIFADQPNRQYNSLTEYTLNNTPLTSAGRTVIEGAIKKDLSFLQPNVVQVSIISDNHVSVFVSGDFGETAINFRRRPDLQGDFFFIDFNNDFF